MTGREPIAIRSLSSGGFIAEKEGTLMNLRPWADPYLARLPNYHELTPPVERGGAALPLDFNGTANAWNLALHLLLTAVEPAFGWSRLGQLAVHYQAGCSPNRYIGSATHKTLWERRNR